MDIAGCDRGWIFLGTGSRAERKIKNTAKYCERKKPLLKPALIDPAQI